MTTIDKRGSKGRTIMRKLRLGEISGVDRPAQVGARALIMKRADDAPGTEEGDEVAKFGMEAPVMLTAVDGHVHLLDAVGRSGETTWEHSEGEDHGHTHPWIRTEDGSIRIGLADGHTHEIEASSGDDLNKTDGAEDGATDPDPEDDDVSKTTTEPTQVDPRDAEIADLKKRAERSEKVAELNDAQRSYWKGLSPEEQDTFLGLSDADRDSAIEKAAGDNPVEYTDTDGREYRKSDGAALIDMAKRLDKERAERVERDEQIRKADLRKRADELDKLPNEDGAMEELLGLVDQLPTAKRAKVLEALGAANGALAKSFTRAGVDGEPDEAETRFGAIVKRFMGEDPKLTKVQAEAKAMGTREGREAYSADRQSS